VYRFPQQIIDDPLMRNSAILVLANKQDLVCARHVPPLPQGLPLTLHTGYCRPANFPGLQGQWGREKLASLGSTDVRN
jgi:hypothetical protein